MYEQLIGFIRENKSYCIAFIMFIIFCICGAWLSYDYGRNTEVYDSTDECLERIEERTEAIRSGIDRMQGRVEQSQETVSGLTERIERSAGNAETIESSVVRAESRLAEATQRIGRIKNIIADIEAENRQRKADSTTADLAK